MTARFGSGEGSRLADSLLGDGSADRGRAPRSLGLLLLGRVPVDVPFPKSTTHEEVGSRCEFEMACMRSSSVLRDNLGTEEEKSLFGSESNCRKIWEPGLANSNSLFLASVMSPPTSCPHQSGCPYSLLALLRAGEFSGPTARRPSLRCGEESSPSAGREIGMACWILAPSSGGWEELEGEECWCWWWW